MRMTRTGQYVETLTFGTRTEARRMAARVRGLHRQLSGVEETTGRAYRVDDPDLLLWVHNCAVDSLLSTARRAGLPLSDEDADTYVLSRSRRPGWSGVRRGRCPRTVADLDAYFEEIRPALALTPAASEGVRRLFVPPMKGWVQVLTPARPAWGTFVSLGFAPLPVGRGRCSRCRALPDRRGGHGRAEGLPDGAARGAERARWSPIVRAGLRARGGAAGCLNSGSGVVLGEEAPRLAGGDGGLAGRAAGPEVAPAALHARDRRERGVRLLPRGHAPGRRGDVDGDVLRPADVVGQRPLRVLEGSDRAAGQVVQLDPRARPPQGAPYPEHVGGQRR